MIRTEIKTATIPHRRRAKPLAGARFREPDFICCKCIGGETHKQHNCKSARCKCALCGERAGR